MNNVNTHPKHKKLLQGCGNANVRLVQPGPISSRQVENFNLLVLGQVQNLL